MPFIPRPTPWPKLVADGVPQFLVARRPMFTHGALTEIGEPVPPQIALNKLRLRQLYEARLITPVGGMLPAYQIPAHRPQPQAQSQQAVPPPLLAPSPPRSPKGYTPPRQSRQRTPQ